MKRPLIAIALVLVATAAQAQTRYVVGSASMPRDPQTDPLGPRSEPTTTVAAAVARTQIEKAGYTGVRSLHCSVHPTAFGTPRRATAATRPSPSRSTTRATSARLAELRQYRLIGPSRPRRGGLFIAGSAPAALIRRLAPPTILA
jgi:hypothetical protein